MAQIPGSGIVTHPNAAPFTPMLDAEGGVDMGIPVKVTYIPSKEGDTTPFKMQYARQTYTLRPHLPTIVPYMAMVLYMGDPRAVDVPGDKQHLKHRRLEVERMRTHWGIYEDDSRWENVPNLIACPIDSDEPFNTVLDDPDGIMLDGTPQPRSEVEFLRAEVERLTHATREMMSRFDAADNAQRARVAAGLEGEEFASQVAMTKAVAPEEMAGSMTSGGGGGGTAGPDAVATPGNTLAFQATDPTANPNPEATQVAEDGSVVPRTKQRAEAPPDAVTEDGPNSPR